MGCCQADLMVSRAVVPTLRSQAQALTFALSWKVQLSVPFTIATLLIT